MQWFLNRCCRTVWFDFSHGFLCALAHILVAEYSNLKIRELSVLELYDFRNSLQIFKVLSYKWDQTCSLFVQRENLGSTRKGNCRNKLFTWYKKYIHSTKFYWVCTIFQALLSAGNPVLHVEFSVRDRHPPKNFLKISAISWNGKLFRFGIIIPQWCYNKKSEPLRIILHTMILLNFMYMCVLPCASKHSNQNWNFMKAEILSSIQVSPQSDGQMMLVDCHMVIKKSIKP